ncbi:MAG: vWA domain-containing protein [Gammaproteobacteria bacterium]
MSALDLFASALGGFILIMLIVLPYYHKQADAEELVEQLEKGLETARIEAENARKKAIESMIAAAKARAEEPLIKEEIEKIEKTEKANADASRKLTALQKDSEKRVEFALLGLPTTAKSFLLVVDMSGSMQNYVPQMMKAVRRVIDPLDAQTSVAILGYRWENNGAQFEVWPSSNGSRAMDVAGKRDAGSFLAGLSRKFNGGTPTLAALGRALEHPAESIMLLSDGAPTDIEFPNVAAGGQLPDAAISRALDEAVRSVSSKNVRRKQINSIAIGDYVREVHMVKFLSLLARRNNGNFVGVAR